MDSTFEEPFSYIYVVVLKDKTLLNNRAYDKMSAERVKNIAIKLGNTEVKVITLDKCLKERYSY
jgi:hypothetical protein